jgi:hypothetical protein
MGAANFSRSQMRRREFLTLLQEMSQSCSQITQADSRSSCIYFSVMTSFANAFLLVFAGLFPILNPGWKLLHDGVEYQFADSIGG